MAKKISNLQVLYKWNHDIRKMIFHSRLRFENHTNKKTLKQAWRFFLLCDLFVTQGGFEPPTLRAEI